MKVLLIVDDMEEMTAMFRRFLRRQFDEVHGAHSAAEAEALLRARCVTHLVVDETLAPGDPKGSALLARWRPTQPQLRWAALFTGDSLRRQQPPPPGADAVFLKPNDFDALIARLRALALESA